MRNTPKGLRFQSIKTMMAHLKYELCFTSYFYLSKSDAINDAKLFPLFFNRVKVEFVCVCIFNALNEM